MSARHFRLIDWLDRVREKSDWRVGLVGEFGKGVIESKVSSILIILCSRFELETRRCQMVQGSDIQLHIRRRFSNATIATLKLCIVF